MNDHDSLSYGVVIRRLEGGDWWHGHIVRTDLEYHSVFLGRRTNLLFVITKFGCGATRKTADFYLTLDSDGVSEELFPIQFTGDWGEDGVETDLQIEALHIRDHILPQMHDSERFQSALAHVVEKEKYGKVAAAKHFYRISGDM